METLTQTKLALAAEVAKHLTGWKVESDNGMQDNAVYLTDGVRQIRIGTGRNPNENRLSVQTWCWPKYMKRHDQYNRQETRESISPHMLRPQQESPSITVSGDKTPEQIAKDILRRFIPEYLRVWDLCQAEAFDRQEYEDRAVSGWAAVCKAIGPKATDLRNSQYVDINGVHLRVENRSGMAHIEGDLTAAQFEKLLAALK